MPKKPTTTRKISYAVSRRILSGHQEKAANDAFELFLRGVLSVLLKGLCQGGKTRTAVLLAVLMVKHWRKLGRTFAITVILHTGNRALRKQLRKDFSKELDVDVNVYMLNDISHGKFKTNQDVDFHLVISDECEEATGSPRVGVERPIPNYLRKEHGIILEKPFAQWKKTNRFYLSISATPGVKELLQEAQGENFCGKVYLEPGPDYCGFEWKLTHNLLRQSEPLVDNGNVTTFFADRLGDFLRIAKPQKRNKMILRAIGASVDVIVLYIQEYLGDKVSVRICDCGSEDGTEGIPSLLASPSEISQIIIIRGGCRRGIQIPQTEYIALAIESPDAASDTVMQGLVGRFSGHTQPNGHSRQDDNFLTYCNLKERKEILDYARNTGSPGSGLHLGKQRETPTTTLVPLWVGEMTEENIQKALKTAEADCRKDGQEITFARRMSSRDRSGVDIAHDFESGARRGYNSALTSGRVMFCDGPSVMNQKFARSWKSYMKGYAYYHKKIKESDLKRVITQDNLKRIRNSSVYAKGIRK